MSLNLSIKKLKVRKDQPLLNIQGPIDYDVNELLTKAIREVVGQICMCVIHHSYAVQEQLIYRFMPRSSDGMSGLFGPSHDSDYMSVEHNKLHVLWWRAEHDPQMQPAGNFIIPCDQHAGIDGNLGWFWEKNQTSGYRDHSHISTGVEYREGPVRHRLLVNMPFELDPEFSLPEGHRFKPNPKLMEMLNIRFPEYSPEEVLIQFFLGDAGVTEGFKSFKPCIHKRIAVAQAFEHLGCTLTPDFREQTEQDILTVKAELKQAIIKAVADNDLAVRTKLLQQYEEMFGEKLTSIDI